MQKRTKKLVGVLLALLMISGCFTGVISAYAEESVPIDAAHFPDEGWRQIVAEYYDKDDNNELSPEERSVTTMSITGMKETLLGEDVPVKSIEGIEYFTDLETLRCGGIGLTTLDVSKLTNLVHLTCQGNELKELIVRYNVMLQELNCADNNLSELSLTYNINLERLLCENNDITSLDTSTLSHLVYLKCSNNNISSLNLASNSQLQTLICSNNHISALDLSANTQLAETTASAIGNQTITAQATQSNNTFYVAVPLAADRIVYTNMESYSDGQFVTTDYSRMLDGFVYDYSTGNSNSEPIDVTVTCEKNFYQVRFYTDESKTTLIAANAVNSGETVQAPDYNPGACIYVEGWSDSLENITADKDVYAICKEKHHYAVTAFSDDNVATISCTGGCGYSRTVRFLDCLNAKTGSENYEPLLDVNSDGYINGRDYVLLLREFNK